MKIVPNANSNSNQLMFCKVLGNAFTAPKAPEVSFAAKFWDSFKISASVMFPALFMVSLKSSKTKIPSSASSFKIFSKITSSACDLKVFTNSTSSFG